MLFGLFGSKKSSAQAPRTDYVQEAIAFEQKGDFEHALNSLRLALRESPNDVYVLQNIAICYTKQGQVDTAIRTWQRVIQLNSELPAPHYGLAFLYLRQGDLQLAGQHLNRFLSEAPIDIDARQWIQHAEQTRDMLARRIAEATRSGMTFAGA